MKKQRRAGKERGDSTDRGVFLNALISLNRPAKNIIPLSATSIACCCQFGYVLNLSALHCPNVTTKIF